MGRHKHLGTQALQATSSLAPKARNKHQAARKHASIRAPHQQHAHVTLQHEPDQSAVVTVALTADNAQAGACVLAQREEHLGYVGVQLDDIG